MGSISVNDIDVMTVEYLILGRKIRINLQSILFASSLAFSYSFQSHLTIGGLIVVSLLYVKRHV